MRRDKRVALHPLAFLDAVVETQGISAEQSVLGFVLILATLAITAQRSRRSAPSGSRCLRSEPAGRAS
jgi:hypothetical protein